MKAKLLIFMAAAVIASAGCASTPSRKATSNRQSNAAPTVASAHTERARDDGHGHDHSRDAGRVPAFESNPKNLPSTLAPESFTGLTRQAYAAVREIPATIAQLPCYCHCDRGFGHKSLHSCYVDDHASMCAVCVEEVLMAYRLEKQDKLTPEQIRERIIEKYSKTQH